MSTSPANSKESVAWSRKHRPVESGISNWLITEQPCDVHDPPAVRKVGSTQRAVGSADGSLVVGSIDDGCTVGDATGAWDGMGTGTADGAGRVGTRVGVGVVGSGDGAGVGTAHSSCNGAHAGRRTDSRYSPGPAHSVGSSTAMPGDNNTSPASTPSMLHVAADADEDTNAKCTLSSLQAATIDVHSIHNILPTANRKGKGKAKAGLSNCKE